MKKLYVVVYFILFGSVQALASPNSLNYQGRILKTDGTPLEYEAVVFNFKIMDPSGQYVLWEENANPIDMTGSKGLFDVPLGEGARTFPDTNIANIDSGYWTNFSLIESFNNTHSFYCKGSTLPSCYSPVGGDMRLLRVRFWDGVAWRQISPDTKIRSVPYSAFAESAEKLAGKSLNEFLLKATVPNCGAGSFLTWSTATQSFGCSTVPASPALTAADIPSLDWSKITTGKPTTLGGYGITDALLAPAANGAAGQVLSTDGAGHLSWVAISTGNFITALSGDVAATGPGSVGSTVTKLQGSTLTITSPSSGQYLKFNGTAFVNSAVLASDISGTLTAGNIPNLDWSVITTGKPTTLAGYGITDAVKSVSATSPLSSSGGTTPVISIQQATTAQAGYLSSADWNTFNGKQAAGNYLTGLNGDISATGPGTGSSTLAKIQGTTVTIGSLVSGQYLKFNGSAFVNSGIVIADVANLSTTLSNKIDASQLPASCAADQSLTFSSPTGAWSCTNITLDASRITSGTLPTARLPALSGDVTSAAGSGTLTLANSGVTAGTYKSVTVDAKGRVTAGTNPTTLAGYGITDALPLSGGTLTGNLQLNTSLVFKDSGSNTVTVKAPTTVTTSYALNLPTGGGSAGQVLSTDGAGNLSWVANTTGSVTSVAATSPLASTGGTTPTISIQQANSTQAGYLSSADWSTFNGKQSAGNYLTALSGDVTATGPGSVGASVAKLQGSTLTISSPSSGQYLKYNGTAFVNSAIAIADVTSLSSTLSNKIDASQMPANCTANQTLTFSSPTGTWSCANIAITGSAFGSQAANLFLAAPTGAAGIPTFRGIAAVDVPALDWTKITTGKPTTIAGYGITDGFTQGGNNFGATAILGTNGANNLAFETNNTTRMTLDTSGRLGIGVTPSQALHVAGNIQVDNGTTATIYNSGGMYFSGVPGAGVHTSYVFRPGWGSASNRLATLTVQNSDTAGNYNDCVQLSSFGGSYFSCGGLGIGTKNPATQLEVVGRIRATNGPGDSAVVELYNNTAAANARWTETYTDNNGIFVIRNMNDNYTAGATILHSHRFAGSPNVDYTVLDGNVGIGFQPSYKFHANGVVAGVGAYVNASDIRLKKNIEPILDAREKLLQLQGVSFDWRQDEYPDMNFGQSHDMGVIAQDVEKVFPEAVLTDRKGFKSVAYSKLVAPLIQAVKELYAKIASHDDEITALKKENADLKERLERLEKAYSTK